VKTYLSSKYCASGLLEFLLAHIIILSVFFIIPYQSTPIFYIVDIIYRFSFPKFFVFFFSFLFKIFVLKPRWNCYIIFVCLVTMKYIHYTFSWGKQWNLADRLLFLWQYSFPHKVSSFYLQNCREIKIVERKV